MRERGGTAGVRGAGGAHFGRSVSQLILSPPILPVGWSLLFGARPLQMKKFGTLGARTSPSRAHPPVAQHWFWSPRVLLLTLDGTRRRTPYLRPSMGSGSSVGRAAD